MQPLPSELMVSRSMGRPSSCQIRMASAGSMPPEKPSFFRTPEVISAQPPRRANSFASAKRAGSRFRWVGMKCFAGISVSSMTSTRVRRPVLPVPRWNWTTPALPESIPPRRAWVITRFSSSFVGWEERWSEMASSPMPSTLSIRMMSRRASPVRVWRGSS